ncbi:MAG: hypothetical protein IKR49_01065 [Clostridia bacterium]|nr:hypothetical protein [Clostridia bacterium]
MKKDKERIRLGSGKLYIAERDDAALEAALVSPAAMLAYCETLAVKENILGLISGGAAVNYTKSVQTIADDLEKVSKTIITTESATLQSGIMTWNLDTLQKVCETARIDEDPILGLRRALIGGLDNADGKTYVLLFLHEDPADGNIWVLITGKNTSGFKLEFKKDAATVVDATFTAEALDDTGTKLAVMEQIPASGVLTITSAEGSQSGRTKLTLTNTLSAGESYVYKAAAAGSLSLPGYLDAVSTTGQSAYTAWDGTADISTTNGYDILLVVKNADGKVVKAGIVTAVCKA